MFQQYAMNDSRVAVQAPIKMGKGQPAKFVHSARCPALQQNCSATASAPLLFAIQCYKSQALHFARLVPFAQAGPVGIPLPFARIARVKTDDEKGFFNSLLPDNVEEQRAAPRRGHSDEWYQERCVFCTECKTSVNSTHQKRGSRCHGCRRWFHIACMPPGSDGSKNSNQQGDADTAAGMAAAGRLEAANRVGGESERHHTGLFFHRDSCKELYHKLATVAAAGEQHLAVPAQRSFLPWQQQQTPEQQTWRLLDLAEVRHLYKDAQRRGSLFKQHTEVQRQLADFAADSSSSSSSKAAGSPGDSSSSSGRRVVHTRLEDFLMVCEMLKSLGDSPKDLLEDSYAIITRNDRGAPLCAGTVNVFGSDHARLQGLATPQHLQRQGHASRCLKQVEAVLQGAGVQQLVVILEPQSFDRSGADGRTPTSAVERWLRKGLGYHTADTEQHMLWRRELPEYHKNLTAGCTLLMKPLTVKQKGWW